MIKAFLSLATYLQVLIVGSLLVIVFYFLAPERKEIDPSHLPWNAHYNESKRLFALGVELNHSTVSEAKLVFGDDYEVKMFSQKDESEKVLEVYFPSVYIASIHSAILLKVNITAEELESAYSRGTGTTVNKSGNREVDLSIEDQPSLLARTFSVITMIPRKNLSSEAIQKRFGVPERIEKQSDQLDHWFYPKKGLELLYDPDGPEALQFSDAIKL